MKMRARISGTDALVRRLRNLSGALGLPAAAGAAESLVEALRHAASGVRVLATRGTRHVVGSPRAEAAAREFGTIENNPRPWLAPSLPPMREPMRAAAAKRLRDTLARGAPAARSNSGRR